MVMAALRKISAVAASASNSLSLSFEGLGIFRLSELARLLRGLPSSPGLVPRVADPLLP